MVWCPEARGWGGPGSVLRGEVFDLRGVLAVASPPAATVRWSTDQEEAGGRPRRPLKI